METLASYLTVSEHGSVVALEAALDKFVHARVVDTVLLRVDIEHKVIGEGFVLAQQDLWFSRRYQRAHMTALDLLLGHLRANPGNEKEMLTSIQSRNDGDSWISYAQASVCKRIQDGRLE